MDKDLGWLDIVLAIVEKTNVTAVVVALITGLLAILGNYLMVSRQARLEQRSTRAGLLAEVSALLEIIKKRNYLASLEAMHTQVGATGRWNEPDRYSLSVPIPEHYNRVYQANVSKLGALSRDEAEQIVRFHQLIDSVRADVTEGGVLWSGANTVEPWQQAIDVLKDAIQLGEALTGSTEKR